MFSHPATEPAHAHAHIAFDVIDEDYPQLVMVRFLSHAITDPSHAAELGHQLDLLIRPEFPKKFVLDFQHVRLLSSTAFGALVSFILKVRHADGQVKICNMDEFVRFGADVIRIGDYAEFVKDQDTALAEFLDHKS
jgi:anti-anti-sigma regulatory factor